MNAPAREGTLTPYPRLMRAHGRALIVPAPMQLSMSNVADRSPKLYAHAVICWLVSLAVYWILWRYNGIALRWAPDHLQYHCGRASSLWGLLDTVELQ